MTGPVLAPAAPEDAPALAAAIGDFMGARWSAASVARLLALPGAFALLARTEAGGLVGALLATPGGGGHEIAALGVSPAWRRRGIGRALVAAALARAPVLSLDVAADNAAARALYRGLGFVEAGRRRGYYPRGGGPAADALVLVKPAPPPAK